MAGIMERGITRYRPETIAAAQALRLEGLSYRAIADRLGVSGDVVVRRWCDEEYRQKYNKRAKMRARGL
jgi:transposase